MTFDKKAYISDKAYTFVTNSMNASYGTFQSNLKFNLSRLNDDIDKREFINRSLELMQALPAEEQKRLQDYIYILQGTHIG